MGLIDDVGDRWGARVLGSEADVDEADGPGGLGASRQVEARLVESEGDGEVRADVDGAALPRRRVHPSGHIDRDDDRAGSGAAGHRLLPVAQQGGERRLERRTSAGAQQAVEDEVRMGGEGGCVSEGLLVGQTRGCRRGGHCGLGLGRLGLTDLSDLHARAPGRRESGRVQAAQWGDGGDVSAAVRQPSTGEESVSPVVARPHEGDHTAAGHPARRLLQRADAFCRETGGSAAHEGLAATGVQVRLLGGAHRGGGEGGH